jgi:Na+-transporting NADH:ubiquinone oxidoreductase subunit A
MRKIKVKRGLEIPLHGSVENIENIDQISPKFLSVLPEDYFGLKPKILIKEGEKVLQGQPILEDKTNEGFYLRSPVSGEINSINRGEKRALVSIIIKRQTEDNLEFKRSKNLNEELNNSGLWDSFRERPFNRVPSLNSKPDFIFVNACKTDKLDLDPNLIIELESENFLKGLQSLIELADERVYLCSNKAVDTKELPVEQVIFEGNYPSGNSSLHIQNIQPIRKSKRTWTINWQDVIRIGKANVSGRFCFDKYVSIAGPACNEPKVIKTLHGANLDELTAGNILGTARKVSGSLMHGRSGDSYSDFLTRYANQISIVSDEREATFFNWLKLGEKDHSNSNVFLSSILEPENFKFDTNINGGYRAIVPIGAFDEVNPFEIDPTIFLKSLAIGDLVALRELGLFDLAEEDMGIFSYVCPSKYDYVALFNDCMEMIWKEETS